MAEKRNTTVGPQVRAKTKRPDRRLHIALVSGSLLMGMASATQMFAYQFAYQEVLGSSFHHLYAPWKILVWMGNMVIPTPLR